MNERQLSHEVDRDVTNPYPIYSAVEKQSVLNGPFKGKHVSKKNYRCLCSKVK